MDFVDYYKALGVARTATADEIKRSYRKLSREFHPDLNKSPGAEEKFKQIAEAYEVLGDKENREKYDRYGSAWKAHKDGGQAPPGFEGFDFSNINFGQGGRRPRSSQGFSDFFETFFGGGAADVFGGGFPGGGFPGGGRGRGQARAGQDQEVTLHMNIQDAYVGADREIIVTDKQSGASRTLKVTVPPGVRTGQKIRLKGQGGPGMLGGPRGDVLLKIQIKEDSRFRLEDRDVYTHIDVSPWVAALGGEADLKTLKGTLRVKIPPGASSGQKIRIRGKGFPKKNAEPGDFYAEIRIVLPKTLSDRERELFAALAEASDFTPELDP